MGKTLNLTDDEAATVQMLLENELLHYQQEDWDGYADHVEQLERIKEKLENQ